MPAFPIKSHIARGLLAAALLVTVPIVMSACGKSDVPSYASSPLVGVWRMSNDDSTQLPKSMADLDALRRKGFDVALTLRKDGTASLSGTGIAMDGTWQPDGDVEGSSGTLSVEDAAGGLPLELGEDDRLVMESDAKEVSAVFDRLPDGVMVASIPDEDADALAKEAGLDDLDWEKMAEDTAKDALEQGK